METNHAEIQNKEPKTVYKFRDWNNNFHRSILIHNKIYVPSPKELNDPFDFQLKLDFNALNTQEKKERLITHLIKDCPANEKVVQHVIQMDKLIRNPAKFEQDFNSLVKYFSFKYYGVLCLSTCWSNILMWSHYSNSHTGFCIGFNNDKLADLLLGNRGPINYPIAKKYPSIDPLDWFEKPINTAIILSHTKSFDWVYEKEYRHLKLWDYEPSGQKRTFDFDGSIIDEIILGLNISIDNEKEIRTICESKNIPVFKIKKSDSQFVLERDKL